MVEPDPPIPVDMHFTQMISEMLGIDIADVQFGSDLHLLLLVAGVFLLLYGMVFLMQMFVRVFAYLMHITRRY